MTFNDLNIDFECASTSFTLEVKKCIFQLELVGRMLELIEYDLQELLHGGRMAFAINTRVDATEAANILLFLEDDEKELTIDGFTYAVVNDEKNHTIDFSHFQGSNAYADLKLRFRRRTLGVDWSEEQLNEYLQDHDDFYITDDQGNPIETT